MTEGGRRPVLFDEDAFDEDVAHATSAGRAVAADAKQRMERDGIALSEMLRCEAEGRDGTRLEGCVKTYLPQPLGDWGMVFSDWRLDDGTPAFLYLAFGRRHPLAAWQPSVYQVAHRRLHADESESQQGP